MSSTRLRVSKLHGAGNDFLVTVGTTDRGPDADVAVRLCDRHRGIGADGLVTLLPGRDGADCAMELRNADGSLAETIRLHGPVTHVFDTEVSVA